MADQTHTIIVKFDGRDAGRQIAAFEQACKQAGIAGGSMERAMEKASGISRGSFASGMKAAAIAVGAVVAGIAVGIASLVRLGAAALNVASKFIDASREMEGYRMRLVATMRSQDEANKLFDMAAKFARTVTAEYREIMAGAALLSATVKGSADQIAAFLPLIADIATVSGLTFEDTARNVQRMWSAGLGAADQFRDSGVLAMLGFEHGAKMSIEEVRKQLINAWKDPEGIFAGAAQRMANTWDGQMSMMSDAWFDFRSKVMEQGLFDSLKKLNAQLIEVLQSERFQEFAISAGRELARVGGYLIDLVDRFVKYSPFIALALADTLRVFTKFTGGVLQVLETTAGTIARFGKEHPWIARILGMTANAELAGDAESVFRVGRQAVEELARLAPELEQFAGKQYLLNEGLIKTEGGASGAARSIDELAAAMLAAGAATENAGEKQATLNALLDASKTGTSERTVLLFELADAYDAVAVAAARAAQFENDNASIYGIKSLPVPDDADRRGAPKSTAEIEAEARKAADAQADAARQTAEAWFRAAQIMADAVGGAFGKMGDDVSRFINQVIQVIALMQQMADISRATAAAGGGGGGGFGSLFGMFGGGGGGTSFNNSAAGNYFSGFFGKGAKGGAAGPGAGGWGGALMGAGIGAGIAGIGGMLGIGGKTYASGEAKDYATEGGTIGGAIGGFFGPAGAVIGGAIGTIAGSLIKRGADTAIGQVDAFSKTLTITSSEGKTGEALRKVGDAFAAGIAQFEGLIGATFAKVGAPGLKLSGGVYSVFGGGAAFRTKDEGEAVAEALFRAIKNADMSGISEQIVKAIESPLSKDLATLQANVQVALDIDKLGVPEFARGIKEAIDSLNDLKKAGVELGLDISKVDDEIARVLESAANDYTGKLLGFLGDYYTEAAVGEEMRRKLEQANFAIRFAELQVEFQMLSALGAFSAETLAMVQGALDWIVANPPTFEDPAAAANRELARGEKERRQQERTDELAAAFDTLGGSMLALRDSYKAAGDAIKVLDDRLKRGAITQAEYTRAVQEFAQEASLAFGDNLMGFIDRYYGEVEGHEEVRLRMAQARFDFELGMLKAEFILLKGLGVLSDQVIADFQLILDWVDGNRPDFNPPEAPALAPLTPVEQFLKRLSDAANDPAFTAHRGFLGIFQSLLSNLPDDAMVPGFRVTGRSPAGTNQYNSGVNAVFELIDAEMTAAEARFELEKAIKLLDLEVLKAQLMAIGAFEGFAKDLYDRAFAAVSGATYTPPGLADNTAALNANTDALREARASFQGMWTELVLGQTGGGGPVEQLAQKFAAMKDAFQSQSLGAQASFLQGQNVQGLEQRATSLGLQWFYKGKPFNQAIAESLYDALVKPIEDLKLDELFKSLEDERLRPIRDFFDELRTSGSTLTRTQRYDNTYQAFLDAAGAGNIDKAVGFGRELLQGIGLQQFGGSTQGYQDLYDFVVRTLGGFDPNGPPDDLLSKSVNVQMESRVILQKIHDDDRKDNRELVAAVDRNTKAIERNLSRREGGGR